MHNNILRTITYNNYRCHITPLYKSLIILKLHDIYKLELAKLMHKFHHEMFPTSFKDLLQKTAEVHCRNARYATNQNYFMQQVPTNAGKKTISNGGATHWANVDQQIKDKSHGVRSKQTRSKQTIHNRPLKTDHVHNRPVHNRPVHNRPVHNRPHS